MKILKISDGKAGHLTVTDGVIEAIEKNCPVEVDLLTVRLRAKFLIPLMKLILKSRWLNDRVSNAQWLISFFYKLSDISGKTADLVISTGGDTAFLNIWLSQRLDAKNIYCSSLRGVDPAQFSLIVGTIDYGVPNAVTLEMAPVKTGMADTAARTEAFCKEKGLQQTDRYYTLLIGGNGAGYRYGQNDLKLLAEKFMACVRRDGAKALITTSRRTGEENERFLEEILSPYHEDIAYQVYFGKNPEKVVAVFLALASSVFVTEESGSMITEAVLSKKPVFTIRPQHVKEQKRYNLFLDTLFAKKRIKRVKTEDAWTDTALEKESFVCIEKTPVEVLAERLQPFLKDIKV